MCADSLKSLEKLRLNRENARKKKLDFTKASATGAVDPQ